MANSGDGNALEKAARMIARHEDLALSAVEVMKAIQSAEAAIASVREEIGQVGTRQQAGLVDLEGKLEEFRSELSSSREDQAAHVAAFDRVVDDLMARLDAFDARIGEVTNDVTARVDAGLESAREEVGRLDQAASEFREVSAKLQEESEAELRKSREHVAEATARYQTLKDDIGSLRMRLDIAMAALVAMSIGVLVLIFSGR